MKALAKHAMLLGLDNGSTLQCSTGRSQNAPLGIWFAQSESVNRPHKDSLWHSNNTFFFIILRQGQFYRFAQRVLL